jgi:nucleotide-binding universal stress UspA family protein
MIKDIVANLSVGQSRDVTTDFAVSVAATFGAHLAGVAFLYEPILSPGDISGIPPDLIDSLRAENEKAAKAAASKFDAAVRGTALSADVRVLDATDAGAPNIFAEVARRFDLSIIAQPNPDSPGPGDPIAEAALFQSGRPVLVVPYIQRAALKLDHLMLCWDGSRSAARAVGDAMPFIVRAKATEIVTVANEAAKSDEMPGADIAHHLARHGAKVEVNRIVSTETDVASTILSHAADSSADFLVMGGYGHSRLREFVLGGATRGILASMTLPTLLSH